MYTNNRDAYRKFFFTAWQNYEKKLALDASETQLISVILQHPEYAYLFEKPEKWENQEFALEDNPFFHMSLHVALLDQLHTNRPSGIRFVQQQLIESHQDPHYVDHLMMERICRMMAIAQETGIMPNDVEYMKSLQELIS